MRALFGIGIKSVILMIVVAGCATTARSNSYGLDSARVALVRQTCQEVMGLEPGQAQFNGCTDVLAQSVQRTSDARRLGEAHAACRRQGKTEGTPELARCVLSMQAELVSDATPERSLSPAGVQTGIKKISYFRMDRAVRLEHEKLSCAQLGLDPINHAFDECVVGLSEAFFDFDNPL